MAEWIKVEYLEDFADRKKGEIVDMSLKNAKEIVKEGICKYVEEPKETKDEDGIFANISAANYKKLKSKYPAVDIDNIIEKKVKYYRLKPFKEKTKLIWVEQIKEYLELVNEDFQESPTVFQIQPKQEQVIPKETQINRGFIWLEEEFWDSFDKVKGHTKKELGHNSKEINKSINWVFYAHAKDTIRGKPQLIEQVQKRIPLLRQVIKEVPFLEDGKKTKDKVEVQTILYFDERYDKRYDGYQIDSYAEDFWLYRVIEESGKDYYLFTKEVLPNETCEFKGMAVLMDDFAEISKNMKIKSLSRIFFVKEFVPNVKIITKEELIQLTKEREMTEEEWKEFLALHPNGKLNRFPTEFENLRSAFILSGKTDGYPLHLGIMGTTGTRKTMGIIETTAYKFSEDPSICEGGNSRIKGLSPSFKEKPANIGYLAKSERMGWIDEIGKMVEFESQKHQTGIDNILGELNFLLEHKSRVVGSGNDNDIRVQANSKFMFVTNPVGNKNTIHDHIGLIDPTMMSRILWWVQDDKEVAFVLGTEGIVPPRPQQAYTNDRGIENRKKLVCLKRCWGKVYSKLSRDEFLTIFDTCNSFISEIDEKEVQRLVAITSTKSNPYSMGTVWKPRAEHHIKLLIDGLVKQRCLFKDYSLSFTSTQEDYDLAERILIRMIEGWNTYFFKSKSGWSDSDKERMQRVGGYYD